MKNNRREKELSNDDAIRVSRATGSSGNAGENLSAEPIEKIKQEVEAKTLSPNKKDKHESK